MSNEVKIVLKRKDDETINVINAILIQRGIDNAFLTDKNVEDTVKDINKPDSPQAHLQPMTKQKLIETFPTWFEIGAMTFDIAYSRTSQEEAKEYAELIVLIKNDIQYITNGLDFIEKYNLNSKEQKVIKSLNKLPKEPKKLPKCDRITHDLQGGNYLCDSFSPEPFWVIFGNVDKPVFLKNKIYEDDIMNDIYRDKKGLAYLLMPLMELGQEGLNKLMDAFNHAWDIGLREDPNYLLPLIYGLDITNINDVAEGYLDFYGKDKLKQKFMDAFIHTNNYFPYGNNNGFVWNDRECRFIPTGKKTMKIISLCNVLTALLRAMGSEYAAEVMSKLLDKPFKPFEFEEIFKIELTKSN